MNKLSVLLLVIVTMLAYHPITQVLADIPEIRSVNVYNVNGNTILNITVYHNQEATFHLVDTIRVSFGTNTTDLSIGVQSLAPDSTFRITYNAGPITGTPIATVQARCNLHSWSTVNWSGQIPEYTLLLLLITLTLITALTTFLARKKSASHD